MSAVIKRKVIKLVVGFLLLIPFRLPIGVLFIELTRMIANIAGNLSEQILIANVVCTKLIYDVAISGFMLSQIYQIADQYKAKNEKSDAPEVGIILSGFAFLGYITFDVISTHEIYEYLYITTK